MNRSALEDERILRLSPPDTALGMLQRGRGEGFLAAKSMSNDEAQDLVWHCVVHDPRWDLQVESRSEYYALLVEELGIDLGRFSARSCPEPFEDVDQRLVVGVLGELATRGHDLAGQVLLTHVAEGDQWDDAVYQLSVIPQEHHLSQLVSVLEARFSQEERAAIVDRWNTEIPWVEIAGDRPWVKQGFVRREEWARSRGKAPELPGMTEDAATLLAYPWPFVLPKRLVHRLTNMLRDGELEMIVEAVKQPSSAQRVAFEVLGRLNNPRGLEVAEAILKADESGPSRMGALRYLDRLESEHTLPLARAWYGLDDGRSVAAEHALTRHAEPADVPLLIDQLRVNWAVRDFYSLCSYADALVRHPADVPWDLCAEIFEQAEYSYSRGVVAKTLITADGARFIEQFGTAAAFDCNSRVSELALGAG